MLTGLVNGGEAKISGDINAAALDDLADASVLTRAQRRGRVTPRRFRDRVECGLDGDAR